MTSSEAPPGLKTTAQIIATIGMQQKRAHKMRKAIPMQKITKNTSNSRKTTVNLQKYVKDNN